MQEQITQTKFKNQIVFTNYKDITQFPNANTVFFFNPDQPKQEYKNNNTSVIQFNDHQYLGTYLNKYFNNYVQKAIRFNFAYIQFKNKDFFQYMYEIIGCMETTQSFMYITIEYPILKEALEVDLQKQEFYERMFINKLQKIAFVHLFSLKFLNIERNDQLTFVFECSDSKADTYEQEKRAILYEAEGQFLEQKLGCKFNGRPQQVFGELFHQLE